MGDKNRSRHDQSVEDVDNKLRQYMLINKQISKTLTTQRYEIANLKNSLRTSTSDILSLQLECHQWKNKFNEIRKMYVEHLQSMTSELQINFDKINSLADDCNAQNTARLDEFLASSPTTNLSKSVDSSRRVSKTFEATKNRSDKVNPDCKYNAMWSSLIR